MPSLDIAMHAGVTINGRAGDRYRIDYRTDLDGLDQWRFLAEIELPGSSYTYHDPVSAWAPRRHYRAVLVGAPDLRP